MSDANDILVEKLQSAQDDRERTDILNNEAWNIRGVDPRRALHFALKAREFASKANYKKGLGYSYRNSSILHFSLSANRQSLQDAQVALEIFEELDNKSGQVSVLNVIGGFYSQVGHFDKALEYQQKALVIQEKVGEKAYIARILNNIGIIYCRLDQYDQALDHHLKALAVSEELNDVASVADILNNVSIVYNSLGHYETALKYLQKALPIYRAQGNQQGIATTLGNIGLNFQLLGKYDAALEHIVASLEIKKNMGNRMGVAVDLQKMGTIHHTLEEHEKAVPYLRKAGDIYRHLGAIAGEAEARFQTGKIFTSMHSTGQAQECFDQAIELAENAGYKRLLYEIYEEYSHLCETTGEYKNALEYYKQAAKIRREVLNVEKQKAVAGIELRYDIEKAEREKEIFRLRNVELASALENIEKAHALLEEKNSSLAEAYEEIALQQQMLVQANEELAVANRKYQIANQQLVALNDDKNEILGIVAHDLKNPLFSIQLTAENLKRYYSKVTDVSALHAVEMIESAATQMFNLVTNLLGVNALESGKIAFNFEVVDLAGIAKKIADSYQARAHSKNIVISFAASSEPMPIHVDKERIEEVLDNLISNAIKYSPFNRNIWIRVRTIGKRAACEIQDEGPGLTEEDKERLFEKFARLSARPTGGEPSSGLGLSIVKRLVEAMNGKVSCESSFGEGAAFLVEFPKAQNGAGQDGKLLC